MKKTLRIIERGLKDLYAIDTPYRAEKFLISKPSKLGHLDGALCVRPGNTVEVGIYLSREVQNTLSALPIKATWNTPQLNAFCVVAEELSHFHYFLFHASNGRPVSQLEMEIQGEIDRFLLCFFSGMPIETLIDRLFEKFKFRDGLSPEQSHRYKRAHDAASKFVVKHFCKMAEPSKREVLFRFLRRFYRLAEAEKLSVIEKF